MCETEILNPKERNESTIDLKKELCRSLHKQTQFSTDRHPIFPMLELTILTSNTLRETLANSPCQSSNSDFSLSWNQLSELIYADGVKTADGSCTM